MFLYDHSQVHEFVKMGMALDMQCISFNVLPAVPTTKPPSSAATTSKANDHHSIVLLSSDSEDDDELPSLAQRIGLATKTACNGHTSGNCVEQTTVVDVNKEKSVEIRSEKVWLRTSNCMPATCSSESSPASCMAGMAALERHSVPEDVVVTATASCMTNTICCLDSQTSTQRPLTQSR